MRTILIAMLSTVLVAGVLCSMAMAAEPPLPLGLPAVPVPADNPQSPAKIKLGEKLFLDKRFSATGQVACANCHDAAKAFTDSPLSVSLGINNLTGTRNAPTVLNAAYNRLQFWDGREPTLEAQSQQPFLNPVEMGLPNHDPILKIVRSDAEYGPLFSEAFGKTGAQITMREVSQAIAAFERTKISGNSPFDRWYFGHDEQALPENAKRGFEVFIGQGRCVSCHTISQTHALFTDGRFHNLNVGFGKIDKDAPAMVSAFSAAKKRGANVDIAVLSNKSTSELGRFAVTDSWDDLGSFKTSTLRNIELTAPYMHDGSLATLEEVVDFYNNGGRVKDSDPPANAFQSGGIRPLNLDAAQKEELVAFLKSLTSPEIAKASVK